MIPSSTVFLIAHFCPTSSYKAQHAITQVKMVAKQHNLQDETGGISLLILLLKSV